MLENKHICLSGRLQGDVYARMDQKDLLMKVL